MQPSDPEIVKKLHEITGIEERRYAPDDMCASDMALKAAEAAFLKVPYDNMKEQIAATCIAATAF